jgi:hypothetical protein
MKILMLALLLAQPAKVNYVYPVHVQVVSVVRPPNARGGGSGVANVHDPTFGTKGVEFVFDQGCWAFGPSLGDYFAARWQSENELVLLLHQVGSEKVEECKLKTTLRDDATFVLRDGQVTTKPIPHGKTAH